MGSEMKGAVCEIVAVMDRSGSMASCYYAVQSAFDAFIKDQRGAPGECYVSLYEFDDIYEIVYEGRPISEVPPLRIVPRGSTALNDAIGKTITTALSRITDRTRKVIVQIMTDGMENASKEWTEEKVAKIVDEAKSRGWQVIYLGANQDAIRESAKYHIPRGSTMTYAANQAGVTAASASMGAQTRAYRSGAVGQMAFSDDDRKKQEDAGAQKSP